jgi:hypothetical protein
VSVQCCGLLQAKQPRAPVEQRVQLSKQSLGFLFVDLCIFRFDAVELLFDCASFISHGIKVLDGLLLTQIACTQVLLGIWG